MAVSETPRHKLKQYTAGTDPHPTRGTFNAEVAKLEELPAVVQGTTGNRPLSGVGKVLYWDEAVKRFVYDDGSNWNDVAPIGGVTPTGVAVAGNANEGTSSRAARADHTHPLPLAAANAHGAMRNTDKAKLDAATFFPEGGTIVSRNAAGQARVTDPTAGEDAANKQYVDKVASPTTGALRAAQNTFTIDIPGGGTIITREIVFPAGVMRKRPHFTCHPIGTSPALPNIETWWTTSVESATVYVRSTTPFLNVIFTWLALEI